jgi:hypothetical protein
VDLDNSDIIGIISVVIAIAAIIISIYQYRKYKPSPPTELEIKTVDRLIDKILKIDYSITYFTFLEKEKTRKAFSISGNYASLSEKIESKLDRKVVKYPLIANKELIELNYFKDFSENRLLSKGLRKALRKFNFQFDSETLTEKQLIEANFNFALLDQKNPVEILLAIGAIPYRRASIRKGSYNYLSFNGKIAKAETIKNIIKEIDDELKSWLIMIGKKNMYEEKKKSIIPNKELNKQIENLRSQIDKNLSIDLFSVKQDSEIAKELQSLINKKR